MDILSILHAVIGLAFVTLLAWLFSNNRKAIKWKLVGTGILLQFLFAFLVVKTDAGRGLFNWISRLFVGLFSFAGDGAQFVFGSLGKSSG